MKSVLDVRNFFNKLRLDMSKKLDVLNGLNDLKFWILDYTFEDVEKEEVSDFGANMEVIYNIITDIEYKINQSMDDNLNHFKNELNHLIKCVLKTILGYQLYEEDKVTQDLFSKYMRGMIKTVMNSEEEG